MTRPPRYPVRDKRDEQRPIILFMMAIFLLLYWLVACRIEYVTTQAPPPDIWVSIVQDFPLLRALTPLIVIVAQIFSLAVLRHFIPVAAALAIGWLTALTLLIRLHGFDSLGPANTYLSALLSGNSNEKVAVNTGNFAAQRHDSPLLIRGGPGNLIVPEAEVAVTELNGRYYRVLSSGKSKLVRFERVRAVLDLREQERDRATVAVTTKEGIELETSVYVRFKLLTKTDVTPANPFPYDDNSVRRAAYADVMLENGVARSWDTLPLEMAIGELRSYVATLSLDQLVDPIHRVHGEVEPHPNLRHRMRLHTKAKLEQHGIQLLEAQLGAFKLPEAVSETFLRYWQAFHRAPQAPEPTEEEIALREQATRNRIREQMIQALAAGLHNVQLPSRESTQIFNQMLATLAQPRVEDGGQSPLIITKDETRPRLSPRIQINNK